MTNIKEDLHNKVIAYNEIGSIPNRIKLLDKTLYNKISKELSAGNEILFLPNSIFDDRPFQDGQYTKSKYKLVLFGILEDGRKISVCINDIEPYFEVKIPDSTEDKEEFAKNIYEELQMDGEIDFNRYISTINKNLKMPEYGFKIQPTRYEINKGKPLKYFQEHYSYYVKIYFDKLDHRKKSIEYVRAKGLETAHDDLTCYYRVVFRDYLIQPSYWLKCKNYRIESEGINRYIKGDVIQISINDTKTFDGKLEKHLLKDYTMTMCWDIETYNSLDDGEVPMPSNPNHNVFMIGMTFQWYHSGDQILRICLVDYPCAPNPDFLTVVCENEENLIKAFAICFNKLNPEIVMGFNDSSYDWNWIINRAKSYPGLLKFIGDKFDAIIQENRTDEHVMRQYKSILVKIEADVNAEGANLQMYGYIPIDVMLIFRQLYPTSEKWSLNFFLSKNKLGGKEDMPYQEMFRIYREIRTFVNNNQEIPDSLLDKMSLVGKYCVVDSQRCHELTNIRNVLQDKREISNISYTSLFDAFYRANGIKIHNLVIANANLCKLKMTNINNEVLESGKFPGAFVKQPIKGLVISKLSIHERIEKAKLGYKEYSEWLEVSEDEIKEMQEFIEERGINLDKSQTIGIKRKCFRDMLEETTGRPITGLDFSSLYPSLIMAYNLSPEYIIVDKEYAKKINENPEHNLHKIKFEFNGRTIRGWSIRHDNKIDPSKKDFKFGIMPSILKNLFDMRKKLKKGENGLEYWEHKKEQMLALSKEEFDARKEEYEDICFNYNSIDSKQKAVKVFMNTMYGVMGNKRSPLYLLQVAGGITSAGQDNIKKAYKFVEEQKCKVYYGDSVISDTPILIRYTKGDLEGNIDIRTIDNIPGNEWISYPQFKPDEIEPVRIDKQQHLPIEGLETWTSNGWASIKRIIRHKTSKKIYRIVTYSGYIDVTEDHSLIGLNKEKLKPNELKIGEELLHGFPHNEININEEFVLEDIYDICKNFNIDTLYEIPFEILNCSNQIKEKFLNEILFKKISYKTEPNMDPKRKLKFGIRITSSKINIQKIYYILRSLNYDITVQYIKCCAQKKFCVMFYNKFSIYSKLSQEVNNVVKLLRMVRQDYIVDEYLENSIISITEIGEEHDYVYDIETSDGTFQGGVGSIIVKNTDSLYIAMPDENFKEIDKKFYTNKISKLEYWESMVKITFDKIVPLNEGVNNMLASDNGTNFLKMAYEEALYPVLFTAKKKYVGLPHISQPNFDPKVPLFIRGLELKKRGVSDMLKNICMDILKKSMSYENILTIIEIIENKITEIYQKDWNNSDDFAGFIMTGVYKPNKQNVKIHTFKRRMKDEYDLDLVPGERFNYVVIRKYPFKYDHRGRKIALQAGDQMELAELAKEKNMPIDLDYYMSHSVNGQLARFITYHPDFHVEPGNPLDDDEVKKAEETILKHARKFIDNFSAKFQANYENKGSIYKTIYRKSYKAVNNKIVEKYGNNEAMLGIIKLLGFSVDPEENLEDWLLSKISAVVEKKKNNINYGERYINKLLEKENLDRRDKTKDKYIVELQGTYYANKPSILKISESRYLERKNVLESRLKKSFGIIQKVYITNNTIVERVSKYIKDEIKIDEKFVDMNDTNKNDIEYISKNLDSYINSNSSDTDIDKTIEKIAEENITKFDKSLEDGLKELKFIYFNLVSNYEYIYKIRSIVEYLKTLRNKKIKYIKPPPKEELNKIIKNHMEESYQEFMKEAKF